LKEQKVLYLAENGQQNDTIVVNQNNFESAKQTFFELKKWKIK
jgi:hypothetical protein